MKPATIAPDEAAFYEDVATHDKEILSSAATINDLFPDFAGSDSLKVLAQLVDSDPKEFLQPKELWLSSIYDCLAEWDAYSFLAPLSGMTALQIGGKGHAAAQFALAGAKSYLLTPVQAEADYAQELARLCRVRIAVALGIAEEVPFPANTFDRIFTGGCAHHFDTVRAFPEIQRVLKADGRFAAIEPWHAPFYSLGTSLFGKRESVNCKPLTDERLRPGYEAFSDFSVIHHGTLTRYPALAVRRILQLSLAASWRLTQVDDWLSSLLGLRRFGSSIVVLAQK